MRKSSNVIGGSMNTFLRYIKKISVFISANAAIVLLICWRSNTLTLNTFGNNIFIGGLVLAGIAVFSLLNRAQVPYMDTRNNLIRGKKPNDIRLTYEKPINMKVNYTIVFVLSSLISVVSGYIIGSI